MPEFVVRRFAPLTVGKACGVATGATALVFLALFGVFVAVEAIVAPDRLGMEPGLPELLILVVLPVAYAALAFLAGIVASVAYNAMERHMGGPRITLSQLEESAKESHNETTG